MAATAMLTPQQVKAAIRGDGELALLDLREEGAFAAQGHLLFAVPAPLSRLELVIDGLVPRRAMRMAGRCPSRSAAPKWARRPAWVTIAAARSRKINPACAGTSRRRSRMKIENPNSASSTDISRESAGWLMPRRLAAEVTDPASRMVTAARSNFRSSRGRLLTYRS